MSTPDQYAGLSAAERAALEEADDTDNLDGADADDDDAGGDEAGGDADGDADGDAAGDDDDDDDDDGAADDDAGKGGDDGQAGDDGKGGGEGDDGKGKSEGGDDDQPAARHSSDKTREAHDKARETDANAALAKVGIDLEALEKRFEDGDVTGKEYREELKKLTAEQDKAKEVLIEVKVSRTLRAERAREDWEAAQERFFSVPANKHFTDSEILFKALNDQVISLAGSGKTGDEVLAEAKKKVEAAFRISQPAPKGKGEEGNDGEGKAKAGEKPARPQRPSKLPPNLGGVPAAGTESPQEGRFAHLDKLTGRALEDAVAKMSPSDQEAWARAN